MKINPVVPKKEVLHYLRYNSDHIHPNIDKIIDDTIKEISNINYSYTYEFFDVLVNGNEIKIGDDLATFNSKNLSKHLETSTKVALMGVTISTEFERNLKRLQFTDQLKALVYDAVGSAYIEAVCDEISRYFEKEFSLYSSSRFSPGYGDLSLESQRDFYRILKLDKLGVELSESLILIPRKTVTAIVGFTKEKGKYREIVCNCGKCVIPCRKLVFKK